MRQVSFLIVTASVTGLTACGGGGGGGPSYLLYDPAFLGAPNVTAVATLYTESASSQISGGFPISVNALGSSTAQLTVPFDANSNPTGLSLSSSYVSGTVPIANVGQQSLAGGLLQTSGSNSGLAFVTYSYSDYMDFGLWSQTPTSDGTSYVEYFMGGYSTPSQRMPTTGSATYNGMSVGGAYSVASSRAYTAVSDISAAVNFSARSLSLTSSNVVAVDLVTMTSTSAPDFGFTGSGAISGSVASGNLTLNRGETGVFSARFFGPNAEDLGGTFRFTGAAGGYLGSFGASR
jgi:hypothetical protein